MMASASALPRHGTGFCAPARSALSRATPARSSAMYPFATSTIAGVGGTNAMST